MEEFIKFLQSDAGLVIVGLLLGGGGAGLSAFKRKLKAAERVIVALNNGIDEYSKSKTKDANHIARHTVERHVGFDRDEELMRKIVLKDRKKRLKKNGGNNGNRRKE